MAITIPNTFSPSTKIESAQVNANNTVIENALNYLRPTLYTYLPGSQSTGTNVAAEFEIKSAQTLYFVAIDLSIKTAPTGADLIIDINKNGTTIFSTRPQIDAGATTGGDSAVFSSSVVVAGDVLTIDIDQVGSSVAGANLTIGLSFRL